MRKIISIFTFLIICSTYVSAADFIASQSGNWTSGTTWGGGCAAGCVAGVDYPTAGDNVYTNGFLIVANANLSCDNLFIEYNVANGIRFSNAAFSLTVRGTLTGWNSGTALPATPTVDIVSNTTPGIFIFTGAAVAAPYSPYVLYEWSHSTVDVRNMYFNLGAGNTFSMLRGIKTNAGLIRVQTGTLTADPGAEIVGLLGAQFIIDANSTFDTQAPISGGTTVTTYRSVTVNGKLVTTSYVNASTLVVGATGTLESKFNGANQTQGWWYQNITATTLTLSVSSTVKFTANADQNIPDLSYGNLFLDATVACTKTLIGTSSAITNGTLTINSSNVTFTSSNTAALQIKRHVVNNGTWTTSASQTINFNGTSPQTISGTNDITFNGNVLLTNTSITFTRNITFAATTTASTGTVTFSRNFTNNGTFNHNNGTLLFSGSTPSVIGGSSITDFYNITITKNALANNVSLSSAARLKGALSLTNNTSAFATNGNTFTLVSDASSTARIATVPTLATITGNITVQRYIAATNGRYWYHLAAPVSNAPVWQWQTGAPTTGIYITGGFQGRSTPSPLNGINPFGTSMYIWDASTGTYTQYPVATSNELLQPRVGYRAFVRDGGAAQAPTTVAKTISVTGPIVKGNQTFTLQYSATGGGGAAPDGWNLLGNPYASDISADVTSAGWTSTTELAENTVYIWDSDASAYVTCVAGVGNCVIPSGQGFWVRSLPGGGSIVLNENAKIAAPGISIYRKATLDYLTIGLKSGKTGAHNKTYIRYEEGMTNGYDKGYDAAYPDFENETDPDNPYAPLDKVSITTLNGSDKYLINAKPLFENGDTLSLHVIVPEGINTLDFSEAQNLDSDVNILLIDSYKGTVSDMGSNPIYTFETTGDTTTQYSRFKVVYYRNSNSAPQITNGANLVVYPNPSENNQVNVILENHNSDIVDVEISDLIGKTVFTTSLKTIGGTANGYLNLESLTPGVYTLNCKSSGEIFTKKLVIK
ncbi:MAG: T9SS type A sorting domain-containing protein [Cytophagaceae bacterium]|nr:T9SS type A sorting domain-containing protein [Cytophagaceae bacterium]